MMLHIEPDQLIELTLDDGSKIVTRTRSRPWHTKAGDLVCLIEARRGAWLCDRMRVVREQEPQP